MARLLSAISADVCFISPVKLFPNLIPCRISNFIMQLISMFLIIGQSLYMCKIVRWDLSILGNMYVLRIDDYVQSLLCHSKSLFVSTDGQT